MPNRQLHPYSPMDESATTPVEARYFRQSGLTLIQVMVIFVIVGVLGSTVVNYLVDKRCETEATASICTDR